MASQGKKGRKLGRNKNKLAQYKGRHSREKNKLKRIVQSNGPKAALAYAAPHGLTSFAQTLIQKRSRHVKEPQSAGQMPTLPQKTGQAHRPA